MAGVAVGMIPPSLSLSLSLSLSISKAITISEIVNVEGKMVGKDLVQVNDDHHAWVGTFVDPRIEGIRERGCLRGRGGAEVL